MEKEREIIIRSNVTGRMFAGFAMYDTFVRRRGWRSPAVFAGIMCAFGIVCLTAGREKEQAGLIGTVLLAVGLVLPTVWLLMYIVSVRSQIKRLKLSEKKTQYTLRLSESVIHAANGREEADFSWEDAVMLVCRGDAGYLYVEKARAFIIPRDSNWDEVVALAEKKGLPVTRK